MKKLFTLLTLALLFCATVTGQAPEGMVKIDKPERLDSFEKEEAPAPEIGVIVTDFQVRNLSKTEVEIMTSSGSRFYVSPIPDFNPFGYTLQEFREYRMAIQVDKNLIEQFQTRGQTGKVEANILWFTVSTSQVKRDQLKFTRLTDPDGYSKSPRFH